MPARPPAIAKIPETTRAAQHVAPTPGKHEIRVPPARGVTAARGPTGSKAAQPSFVLQAAGGEQGQQCGACTPNVGLDLDERNTKLVGNVLVGEFFEVIENQRHALMLG